MKQKYKILLIGYSNLARKRLLKTFIKNRIPFDVATRSFKKKIKGSIEKFNDYNKALRYSDADIVYLSLPNSMHYYWSKKILKLGYHLIVDKPISIKIGELNNLIKIAKKKKLLISEATFFNYHNQFKFLQKIIGKLQNIEQFFVNFTIPMPKKNSILLSKKFAGGVLMDMGPYIASINRIFFNENLKNKSIIMKKNKKKLITSLDVYLRYETKIFTGTFRFGKDYKNEILIYLKDKYIELKRVFSPPDDIKLNMEINTQDRLKIIQVKKDNCFKIIYLKYLII